MQSFIVFLQLSRCFIAFLFLLAHTSYVDFSRQKQCHSRGQILRQMYNWCMLSWLVVAKMYMSPPSLSFSLLRNSWAVSGKFLTAILADSIDCIALRRSFLFIVVMLMTLKVRPGKLSRGSLPRKMCELGLICLMLKAVSIWRKIPVFMIAALGT